MSEGLPVGQVLLVTSVGCLSHLQEGPRQGCAHSIPWLCAVKQQLLQQICFDKLQLIATLLLVKILPQR